MVGGHVMLELLGVGSSGGLPSGHLVGRVEVVREVLGVGDSHLPAGGKTGIRLGVLAGGIHGKHN